MGKEKSPENTPVSLAVIKCKSGIENAKYLVNGQLIVWFAFNQSDKNFTARPGHTSVKDKEQVVNTNKVVYKPQLKGDSIRSDLTLQELKHSGFTFS